MPLGDGRESDALETSLVSVLQHRTGGCEVVVCHDGSYTDPHKLSGEVRFVDVGTANRVDQIHAGVELAHGRFVHVVADGLAVTAGWSDAALQSFEHRDIAIVVPRVQNAQGVIEHAGWCHGSQSACQVIGLGATQVSRHEAASVDGGFLNSAFWRRDLLQQLQGAYRGSCLVEASVRYSTAIADSEWRCVVQTHSVMTTKSPGTLLRLIRRNQHVLQAIINPQPIASSQNVLRAMRSLWGRQGGFQVALKRLVAGRLSSTRDDVNTNVTLKTPGGSSPVETIQMTAEINKSVRRAA
ncbi:MAG: glycosyltransferase family 2 protein [Planctomycetota bacterium]